MVGLPLDGEQLGDFNSRVSSSSSDSSDHDEQSSTTGHNDKSSTDARSSSGGEFSSSGGQTGSESGREGESKELQEIRRIARGDTRCVMTWRGVSLLMVLISTAFVTWLACILLRREEVDSFEISFELFVTAFDQAINRNVHAVFDRVKDLSESISSNALSGSQVFPFVTLMHFEYYTGIKNGLIDSSLVLYTPFVDESNLESWKDYTSNKAHPGVYSIEDDGNGGLAVPVELLGDEIAAPFWQSSPPPYDNRLYNFDVLSLPELKQAQLSMMAASVEGSFVAGPIFDLKAKFESLNATLQKSIPHGSDEVSTGQTSVAQRDLDSVYDGLESFILYPVFGPSSLAMGENNTGVVGMVLATLPWGLYLANVIPKSTPAVHCIVHNTCGQSVTYFVDGPSAVYIGEGDLHNRAFNGLASKFNLHEAFDNKVMSYGDNDCLYEIVVYPTTQMKAVYDTREPAIFATLVGVTFVLIILVFIRYDGFVERKHEKISQAAARAGAIVSSFFPSIIRDRLEGRDNNGMNAGGKEVKKLKGGRMNRMGSSVLPNEDDDEEEIFKSKPIADLFPDTTVMFADMVGFTAWSSVREPSEVFTLLETIYRAFDHVAKKRRVFKVETVGDCYVAVTGLPDPRKDHAVVMARFAHECMDKCHTLTKALVVTLGPDTADLTMRIGLHSGPVTAGVLRGDRSRFQLFGDTMNVASRMETTGKPGSVHISQETADLLIAAGKQDWVEKRKDVVVAKGKGEMQTYWLSRRGKGGYASSRSSVSSKSSESNSEAHASSDENDGDLSDRTLRLIDWNVEVIDKLLKRIVAVRRAKGATADAQDAEEKKIQNGANLLDELNGVISIQKINGKAIMKGYAEASSVGLGDNVRDQLYEYIRSLAVLHENNPYHNFQHASQVAMTLTKFLERAASHRTLAKSREGEDSSDGSDGEDLGEQEKEYKLKAALILSDPLIQLGCVFSALIFQVGHPGIPNSQVAKENPAAAVQFKGQCITEQKALMTAWDMLMEDSYSELRRTMFGNQLSSMRRFRQILLHAVLATDIMDKELQQWRQGRWEKLFHKQSQACSQVAMPEDAHLKTTLLIEYLVQAACFSHAMQHWNLYQRNNEQLFAEYLVAYRARRLAKRPVDFWYEREADLFDNCILPLAKKLRDCGLLGASGDDSIEHAITNAQNWKSSGQDIVREMALKID